MTWVGDREEYFMTRVGDTRDKVSQGMRYVVLIPRDVSYREGLESITRALTRAKC